MKIFGTEDIRKIDAETIKLEPVSSLDLMERAATAAFNRIRSMAPYQSRFVLFAGPGNNGGDGLVIARLLKSEDYAVRVYIVDPGAKRSDDMQVNLKRLKNAAVIPSLINTIDDFPEINDDEIIVDALFGSGLSRPPEGIMADIIRKINSCNAMVISVDIPSGLFCDDNAQADKSTIVRADHTITFQFPKLAFMFAGNNPFTGTWEVVDIGLHRETIGNMPYEYYYTLPEDIRPLLRKRSLFDHKGTAGHALVIAGSYGKAGAAVLAGKAALRTGAGLVTVHTPAAAVIAVQASLPEAMVSPDRGEENINSLPDISGYDAVGIGPGLGTDPDTRRVLMQLLEKADKPLVIDADALNIIARERDMLAILPERSVLTPHPGEFRRLTEKNVSDFEAVSELRRFAAKTGCVVILKGAHTAIAYPNGKVSFNSSGNPGMATAGSGDVLTGMITSLLAQGYQPEDAAKTGVYLHGRAGDKALEHQSEESLIAGDIINNIGSAFTELRL